MMMMLLLMMLVFIGLMIKTIPGFVILFGSSIYFYFFALKNRGIPSTLASGSGR